MLYWEIVPKYSPDGKLMPEMILVCNALRNDLISPNEYVRGCMLRFLCKLKEPELLEPLIPSVKQALVHRHTYVRRNAALAVYSIHKSFGDQFLPDAAELMETFILNEADVSARRNAFLMLFNEAEEIAIDFMSEHVDDIEKYGDGFALLVLELARKTCRRDPAQKSRFVRCLFKMLQSESLAVSYEAAWTLVSLSAAPTAVRACAQTYATILSNSSSDNNVKLIVLDRLGELKKHHSKVVQEILMDIMRGLSSPNLDIKKKILNLAIDMVGPRNIEDVIAVLKREVVRTQESDMEHGEEYKAMLINSIHKCATRFSEVADSVVLVLLEFLAGEGGHNVIQCVKSIIEQYPSFRPSVVRKIIENFDEMTTSQAYKVALWVLGEYSDTLDAHTQQPMLLDAYDMIKKQLGDVPFVVPKDADADGSGDGEHTKPVTIHVTKNVVLADGTYSVVTTTQTTGGPAVQDEANKSNLRRLITSSKSDTQLATVAAVALTKIALKVLLQKYDGNPYPPSESGALVVNTVLVCVGIGKMVEVLENEVFVQDCMERLSQCVRLLLDPKFRSQMAEKWLYAGRETFTKMVQDARAIKTRASEINKRTGAGASQADDLIQFRQLRAQAVQGGIEVDLMDADDISRATGSDGSASQGAKLKNVFQLTGYSDPVYAEASVVVHDYDILLDILIINRTPNTLTNLTVELATMGDLKLVERPQSYTIGPLDERHVSASIKVSSTETGHIFGTIVFDNASTAQKAYVNLNDIQLNIMDYIRPAECRNENFRVMWAEFEWENKVAVNTNITDLREFVNHITSNTNMTCITPLGDKQVLSGRHRISVYCDLFSVFCICSRTMVLVSLRRICIQGLYLAKMPW